MLSAVELTTGAYNEAGVDVAVTVAVGSAVEAEGLTVRLVPREEFCSIIARALPENSVNHTCPSLSSSDIIRGDELLVGISNSVNCEFLGSKRAILLPTCSLNQTYPDWERNTQ